MEGEELNDVEWGFYRVLRTLQNDSEHDRFSVILEGAPRAIGSISKETLKMDSITPFGRSRMTVDGDSIGFFEPSRMTVHVNALLSKPYLQLDFSCSYSAFRETSSEPSASFL